MQYQSCQIKLTIGAAVQGTKYRQQQSSAIAKQSEERQGRACRIWTTIVERDCKAIKRETKYTSRIEPTSSKIRTQTQSVNRNRMCYVCGRDRECSTIRFDKSKRRDNVDQIGSQIHGGESLNEDSEGKITSNIKSSQRGMRDGIMGCNYPPPMLKIS